VTRDLDAAVGAIAPLVAQLVQLQRRAAQQYATEVDALVRCDSRDVQRIEHTLDGLLSFCGDAAVLALFKRLCRHYWVIDPAATASYIHSYREMWDGDEPEADA
jgi:hypothetical protein